MTLTEMAATVAPVSCPKCNSTGRVEVVMPDMSRHTNTCTRCAGQGKIGRTITPRKRFVIAERLKAIDLAWTDYVAHNGDTDTHMQRLRLAIRGEATEKGK